MAQAEQIKKKLKVEHGQGLYINHAKGQNATLAQLLIRYLWEDAPRNKSFEIEAYKINAMLWDGGLPRQSIEEIITNHPNPCDKVKEMKIRKPTNKKMHESCSATQFILKDIKGSPTRSNCCGSCRGPASVSSS